MTWRPDPSPSQAPHRCGASDAATLALPHGWGAIVAAGNAERGFVEPARMPNGSAHVARRLDPFPSQDSHRGGASDAATVAPLHGWDAVVAAGNAARGFIEPGVVPNGSRAPRRPAGDGDLRRSPDDED